MGDPRSILSKIPIEFVARALDSLDDVYAVPIGTMAEAVMPVLEFGDVRFTAVCKADRRWGSYRYWSAVRADQV
jgi:hypothetical protein